MFGIQLIDENLLQNLSSFELICLPKNELVTMICIDST